MVFEHHEKSLRRLFNFEGFFMVYRKLKKIKEDKRKKKESPVLDWIYIHKE